MIVQWLRDVNEWVCPDRTGEERAAEASGEPLRLCLAVGPVLVPTPFKWPSFKPVEAEAADA